MEQFRQIGEVLGSIKALMLFKNDIQINQRQCCLLLDIFTMAYETIADEMVHNLRFAEKHTRWRILEQPLRELHRTFKEGENYIRVSLETKDWWAKAITLYQNADCVDFYIHNLLFIIPSVIDAIELAGEISGWDDEGEIQNKRFVYSIKYQKEWKDPKLFKWKFGKQYLVSEDMCNRINTVWKEDRWILLNKIREKRDLGSINASKYEQQLADLLYKNLDGSNTLNGKLFPFLILVGSKDYQVKRRLGNGSQYKEIMWLGESFVLRHFFGNVEPLVPEISQILSLSHPNILQFICGFTDEEKKECFLITELMNKDLYSYIKENCGPKKRIPFTLPVAVDLLLQIARGMEYPNQRPSFSSICRILRYIKRFLVMNPDHSHPDAPMPRVDYCDIEAGLLKQFPSWESPYWTNPSH